MSIPDYETIMLPLLKYVGDGNEHSIREAVIYISDHFSLTEEEKNETLASGQTYVYNRVGWARTYMLKAGLLEKTTRGVFRITDVGLETLKKNPSKIDGNFLKQFPGFMEFQQMKRNPSITSIDSTVEIDDDVQEKTPDELIATGFNSIQASLGQDILVKIRGNSPAFFEKVVLKLLENMGYGKGEVTGRSGDGGIDGYIYQDRLGLDKILFQAKRFGEDSPVSASMIRDFIGTLATNEANKGVFITSSRFPKDAENNVSRSPKPIKLIDASKLVRLMIDFNIGVSIENRYEIKKIDTDFFIEDE